MTLDDADRTFVAEMYQAVLDHPVRYADDLDRHSRNCECDGCSVVRAFLTAGENHNRAKEAGRVVAVLPPPPPPWAPSRRDRVLARRFPKLAWLFELPPEERAFYASRPEHQALLGAPDWVWREIRD